MVRQDDIDCDEFQRGNNLLEHRIALLRELRELEEEASNDAPAETDAF